MRRFLHLAEHGFEEALLILNLYACLQDAIAVILQYEASKRAGCITLRIDIHAVRLNVDPCLWCMPVDDHFFKQTTMRQELLPDTHQVPL